MITRTIIRRTFDLEVSQLFPTLNPVLARIMAARGVTDEAQLRYTINRLLPPEMRGLERAVEILADCVAHTKKVLIVGDFDADGATSTALAVRCLRAFGLNNVEYLVPNRFEYGYGLTPEIVAVAAQRAPAVILTVDNGIASFLGVQAAQELGIQVVVTDHHLPGHEVPPADAIVNPNQPGCDFLSKAAAGVGVVFYVMLALRKHLRHSGWFKDVGQEPNLADFLDLVALGTVADVVPLDFNNRVLVAQGLSRMRAGKLCPGIQAILRVAGRDHAKVGASDLGFIVGPRLNAAGRLDDMSIGIRCLLADDSAEALNFAQELDTLNRERRSIEASMQHEAVKELDSLLKESSEDLPSGMCFYRGDWHQGVIGILASRMKDRLHRPVIVFSDHDENELKGSGRSVRGVHLRDVLDRVATLHPGMLNKFGGHAMAAGLSLAREHLDVFTSAFATAVDEQLGGRPLTAALETDGNLEADDLSLCLAEQIEQAGPWGQAFPEPCFDGEFLLLQQKLVGEKHLKMVLAPVEQPQRVLDAIAFNVDTACWPDSACSRVRIVYKLQVNEFRGQRSAQLMVDYLIRA